MLLLPAQTLVAPLSRHAVAFNSRPAAFSPNSKCFGIMGERLSVIHAAFSACALQCIQNCLALQNENRNLSFPSERMKSETIALLAVHFKTLALCIIQGFHQAFR